MSVAGARLGWAGASLTFGLVLFPAHAVAAPHGERYPSDFAGFVISRDLAFLGTLVRQEFDVRQFRFGCAASQDSLPVTTSEVHIDSILFGFVADSVVTIRTLGCSEARDAPAGSRVLVAAGRLCLDWWTPWGEVTPIREDGTLRAARLELSGLEAWALL